MELVDAPHSKCGTFGFVGSSPTAPTALMGTYKRIPLKLVRGKGCWLWDDKGDKYLDAVAGIATCSLGHSNKKIERALIKQLRKLQHVSNLYQIQEQEELAKCIVSNSCGDKVFFCNSGAEANEAAIKLARKHGHINRGIDRPLILSAYSSFHGRTLATISATGQPKYHKGFEPLVEGFKFFEYNNFESFYQLYQKVEASQPRVAAVLIEPIQGEGGIIPGNQNFFKKIRDLCTKDNVLLIFDEVQTGMGRTGNLWGYQENNIEPDVFTLAKGLGGGHAIGALIVQKHADLFSPGEHASTFGGNPFACKAALTVFNEINRPKSLRNIINRGEQLRTGLLEISRLFPNHFDGVRGLGLMQGLLIKKEIDLCASEIINSALKEKLLLASAGEKVIRMVPALTINKYETNQLINRLKDSIEKYI